MEKVFFAVFEKEANTLFNWFPTPTKSAEFKNKDKKYFRTSSINLSSYTNSNMKVWTEKSSGNEDAVMGMEAPIGFFIFESHSCSYTVSLPFNFANGMSKAKIRVNK